MTGRKGMRPGLPARSRSAGTKHSDQDAESLTNLGIHADPERLLSSLLGVRAGQAKPSPEPSGGP